MADGIMDRIETINNIPLCDREARTLLEGKANVDHTHDNYATKTELNLKADVIHTHNDYALKSDLNTKANVAHTHNDYVLKSDLTNLLNRLTTLENKYTEILTRLNNIDAKLDELEGGIAHPSVMYPITYETTEGITLSNTSTSINAGNRYVNTITYADGYTRDSIQIVMGGVDITNRITIHSPGPNQQGFAIEEVSGNLIIRIKAKSTRIPCTSISLYNDSIILYEINSTATNIATVLPANTTDTIRWESSNPAVATVERDKGIITAISEGKCVVTAYCGGQKAMCPVTVDIENSYNIVYYLTGVTSSNNQKTINEKQAYYSVITLTNSNYTITSATLKIKGVTKNNYLTITDRVIVDIPAGIINGDVVITVNTQEKTYPCTSLQCADEMWLATGDAQPIELWIQPTNTTDELTWTVDAYNALYVYKTGSTVYVEAQNMTGTYTITFTCGSYTDTCIVTVGKKDIACTNIAFNVPSIRVSVNEDSWDCAQYLILTPSNTTDPVEWYTNATDYFYVTDNGTISFNRVGTYKVQARCNGKSATLTVIIN